MKKMNDRKASIQPIKSKLKLTILEDSDIRAIDETALNILNEVGVSMPSEKALKIYADAGANVDFTNQTVRIPPDMVKNKMANAPRQYTLGGRERPELDLIIDGQSGTYFNDGGSAAFSIDFTTRKKRSSCKEDVANMAKISDYMPMISIVWPCASAGEYGKAAGFHDLEACFSNTEKHVMTETIIGEVECKYAIEMASTIAGSSEKLRERQNLSILICGIAPLGHDKGGIESAICFAEAGLTVGYMSMPVIGTTSPASQAATLATGLAEVLSAIVLVQLVNPGCPCFMSIIPGIIDPRTGEYIYSSVSAQMTNAASVQLAHHYGLPSYSGSSFGGSAFELNRWQAGRENVYLPLLVVLAGAEMCFSIGLIGDDNIWHPARICFDREINRAINVIGQGIEVTGETLLFDSIREVGPRGHFLCERHTVDNLPKLWDPSFLFQKSNDPAEKWEDPVELAWEEVKWILENHHVPELDSKIQAELKRIIRAGENELSIS